MTRPSPAADPNSLEVFHDPRSVAVIGASSDPSKWGYWLARGALEGGGRRQVHLVNRAGTPIDGTPTVRSLAELPDAPELVVLSVPATELDAVVDDALARGVKGFVGITAGVAYATGRPEAEHELAARVRAHGARLIGPNCLGIYDAQTQLRLAWGTFSPGALGIVSQSGQVGSELANLAADVGQGVSRFVSIGNQADVTADEALADLIDHDATRLVVLYLESFGDGRQLITTLHRLREAGKPTLFVTVGTSEAGRGAARSHTGALTSSMDVIDAACRAAGAIRIDTPSKAIDVAQMLLTTPQLPAGPRVGIVGDSGGQGAIAADAVEEAGLTVAPIGADLTERLAEALPVGVAVGNPLDLAGAGERDLRNYAKAVRIFAHTPDVDAVLLTGYFGSYAEHTPVLAPAEAEAAGELATAGSAENCPVVVHSMCAASSTLDELVRRGVPTYRTVDGAIRGLAGATALHATEGRHLADVEGSPGRLRPGYWAARGTLEAAGIIYPPASLVRDEDDLERVLGEMPGPFVLKADWLEHKSDHGGLAIGLEDAASVRAAYAMLVGRLGRGDCVLEQLDTRPDAMELIVGAHRDPWFGPLVLVGSGGVEAELHRDSRLELAPIDVDVARQMLDTLRCAPLLHGWRGNSAIDVDGVAQVLVVLSDLLVTHPDWSSVEINPLRAGPDGPVAVDALITCAPLAPSEGDR